MFGYVTAHEPELKVKEFHKYKGYYCGLCQQLKRKYGHLGQLTLTYDMTFLIIILTSLYEKEPGVTRGRCKVHPFKKQLFLNNEFTEYAADMNLILAYYHLVDDWEDEHKASALIGSKALKRRVQKAIQKYPRQCRVIREELQNLSIYEKNGSTMIDEPAGCFGRLMAEIFIYREDHWAEKLRCMGFYLGKYIYIMDAYDDLDNDLKEGSYNPLKNICREPDYEERCRNMLCMMLGEASAAFEQLPLLVDIDILRNILYDGVWKCYRKLQEQKEEKTTEEQQDRKE